MLVDNLLLILDFPLLLVKFAALAAVARVLSKEPRGLTIRAQAEYTALQTRRQSQETPEFLKIYHQRAGVEATLSQGIRRTCLRRSRYIGLAKTHLQHILIATALNLVRLDAWLNDVPIAKTRVSRFKKLQQ